MTKKMCVIVYFIHNINININNNKNKSKQNRMSHMLMCENDMSSQQWKKNGEQQQQTTNEDAYLY